MTTPDSSHDTRDSQKIDTDNFEQWVFAIAKYDETFVRSGTRKIMDKGNPLQWIPYPVGCDSRGYHALRDDFEPLMMMAVYGCFVNLLKTSTAPPRYGVLAHSDGQPYKLSMISRITGAPPDLIITTIRWCLRVGWMTAMRIGCESQLGDGATVSHHCPTTAPPVIQQQSGDGVPRREETQQKETQQKERRAKGRSPPPLADQSPPFAELEAYWNESLGVSHSMTSQRQNKLKTRWKDATFRTRWREAIDRITASDFCRGLNDRGWIADLDWFLQIDTLTKINEGKYDNRHTPKAARGDNSAARAEQQNSDALSGFLGQNGQAAIRQSDGHLVQSQANGRVHSGATRRLVCTAERISAADNQSSCH